MKMFTKVANKSVSISGIYKLWIYRTLRLQKNERLGLRIESGSRRHMNTSRLLFYSQQHLKEKTIGGGIKDKSINNQPEQQNTTNDKSKQYSQKNTEEAGKKQSGKSKDNTKSRKSYNESSLVLHYFANSGKKEKENYLECLRMYQSQPGKKIDRVPFIYGALKFMEDFNVHKDLEVYKTLLNIFPKESMIPTNVFQTMFMHYPRDQYCATAVLEQMENNGVIPDSETELLLLNIFGKHGSPLEKYWAMMYWMPKFKNLNPWPLPDPIPDDALELAKLAMIKISSVDVESEITTFDTNDIQDSIDKTWIVSAMAPKQSELLVKHDKNNAIYVEGPFRVYVATKSVDYFILRANPPPDRKFPNHDPDDVDKLRNPYLETSSDLILPPSVHEQGDSTIFAICATGMSSKDSLLSWIRLLEKMNSVLAEIPVIFTLKNYSKETLYVEDGKNKKVYSKSNKDAKEKFLQ